MQCVGLDKSGFSAANSIPASTLVHSALRLARQAFMALSFGPRLVFRFCALLLRRPEHYHQQTCKYREHTGRNEIPEIYGVTVVLVLRSRDLHLLNIPNYARLTFVAFRQR